MHPTTENAEDPEDLQLQLVDSEAELVGLKDEIMQLEMVKLGDPLAVPDLRKARLALMQRIAQFEARLKQA